MTSSIIFNSRKQVLHQAYQFQPVHKETAQQKIDKYNLAAREAYQVATKCGRKNDEFKKLIETTNTNKQHSEQLQATFRELAGLHIFNQVCSDLAFAKNKNRSNGDVLTGSNLLKEHFLIILALKDVNERNPLEKILDKYISEHETYQAIAAINGLASALVLLQSSLENNTTDSSRLQSDALDRFKSLPPKAMTALCHCLWELNNDPSDCTHGYDTALKDITKLLNHYSTCPIEDSLKRLEKEKNLPFEPTDYRIHNQQILSTDTDAVTQDIYKIYQLEELKFLLNDHTKNNDFLISKYNTLNADLRKMLEDIIFISSYEPYGRSGESLLKENLHTLIKSKNKDGVDIASQLISYYSERIKIQRINEEVDNLIRQSSGGSNNHGALIQKFNALSESAKEALRGKIWWYHGGKDNPNFGWWGYGTNKIDENARYLTQSYPGTNNQSLLKSFSLELKEKCQNADRELLDDLKRSKALPENPIDVSTQSLENEQGLLNYLPTNLRAVFITAELKGVASVGGLASALEGMIQGFGADYSKVIMPLYRGDKQTIKQELINEMKPTDHEIFAEGKRITIRKAKINGIRCYFVDLPHLFSIPKDAINLYKIHKEDHNHNQYRWAVFQRAAADLCYLFSKKKHPVDLVHVHDGQAALVPKFLITQHLEEWRQGKTPVTVFTAHNNLETCTYDQHNNNDLSTLEQVGLPKRGMNSFMEALQDSDVQFTVSETFGKEMQKPAQEFGRSMHNNVKKAAFEGHFYGIVNGNTTGVTPLKDEQLVRLNLNYGPNLDVKTFSDKIKGIQGELCNYLKGLNKDDPCYAVLEPKIPIVVYLGRFDYSQKGVDKFEMIMEEILANGAQFVCIGSAADEKAKNVLDRMKQSAKKLGNKGVLILEDESDYRHQNKFKGLLRGGCSLGIFPSCYEPCGLVQGEFNCYGKKAIATKTGGFADTLKFGNGYLFDRHDNWVSNEQNSAIKDTLKIAISEAFAMQNALYDGDDHKKEHYVREMQEIMRRAIASSWETTSDNSLSPTRRIELVYAKGFQRRELRKGMRIDLKTVKF